MLSAPLTPPMAPVCKLLVANTSRASHLHIGEQPSSDPLLPSSHSSPCCKIPSPQAGSVHALEHASLSLLLPSSHCSTPWRTKPSPHMARMHIPTQPSVLLMLPSSHCSTPC